MGLKKRGGEPLRVHHLEEPKQYPNISLRFLTKNKDFGIKALQKPEYAQTRKELLNAIKTLTSNTYEYFFSLGKENGFETLQYSDMNFEADGIVLDKSTKVIVFRFDKQRRRIVAYKEGETFYIIGFDLKYKAYNH